MSGLGSTGVCVLRLLCVLLAWVAMACDNVPELAPASRVDRPRVLAVVAEPPGANPGSDVELSLMLGGLREQVERVEWSACGAFFSTARDDGFEAAPAGQGCGDDGIVLDEGETSRLPGPLTQLLFDNLDQVSEIFGGVLPPELVEQIADEVGIPVLVEARVYTGGQVLRAIKRVVISRRSDPNRNPPAPQFALEGLVIGPDAMQPFACATESGALPRLDTATNLELAPSVDGEEEDWIEEHPVINADGTLAVRRESPFYSWFVSDGGLSQGVTRSPLRNTIWRTPNGSGCHTLWSVVRDGHGGTSACALQVIVGERDACP